MRPVVHRAIGFPKSGFATSGIDVPVPGSRTSGLDASMRYSAGSGGSIRLDQVEPVHGQFERSVRSAADGEPEAESVIPGVQAFRSANRPT